MLLNKIFSKKNNNFKDEEWKNLEAETIKRFEKDAKDFRAKLTNDEYKIYLIMKKLSAVFLLLSFLLCWYNLLWGFIIGLSLSTIWFLIFFKKNLKYALLFYFAFFLSSFYFFVSFIINLITK